MGNRLRVQVTGATAHIVAHPALPASGTQKLAYIYVCLMYGHWKMVASLGVSRAHNKVSRAALDRLILSDVDSNDIADGVGNIWGIDA